MAFDQIHNISWFQKTFYTWLQPYVWGERQDQHNKNFNEPDPLYSVPSYYDPAIDYEAWRGVWVGLRHLRGDEDGEQLLKESFLDLFKHEYWTAFWLHFLGIQLNVFSPFLLYFLFKAIIQENLSAVLVLVIIIIVTRLLRTLFNFVAENKLYTMGQRIYSCAAQAIIDKATRGSLSAEKEDVAGTEISKLMYLDIEKLLQFMLKKSYVANNTISVLSNAFILIFLISWAGLVGFLLLFINFGLYVIAFKCGEGHEGRLGERRDERVKKTMQTFEMIKFVKISALESYFYDKLVRLRNLELESLRKIFAMELIPVFITVISFKLILMVVILMVISSQQTFNPPIFFTAFLLLNNLYFIRVVLDVSFLKEASLAFTTIQKFLLCPEIGRSHIQQDRFKQAQSGEVVISIQGSFYWSKPLEGAAADGLQGVNVAVKRGELVAVVGPYGSGKSSLIKAALGELQPRPGAHVHLYGTVAYVGQRPWIFNASARENVLFGEPFEETRYSWAVAGACLEADFAALEFGDATMIGERGCNLSGGQKLRVGLARALYSNADVLLLDDILSAVDAHVASALFFDTLKQRLRGKTVLLVTHALTFLPHTDRIFILDNGTITATGTFQSLKDHETLKQIQAAKGKKQAGIKKNTVQQISLAASNIGEQLSHNDKEDVSLYMKINGGNWFIVVLVLYVVANVGVHTVLLFWMNQWAGSNDYHEFIYVLVYVLLSIFAGLFAIGFAHFLYTRDHYHDLPATMIETLLRSPLEYFMGTPSAKIIRVLSSDLRISDRVLGQCFLRMLMYFGAFLSNVMVIIVVALIIRNYFVLGNQLVFLSLLAYFCGKFLMAQRRFSEMQHDAKLPLNNTFDETLDGISTIRAQCKETYQVNIFLERLGRYLKCNTVANGLATSTEFITTLVYVIFFAISIALLYGAGNEISYDCVLLASIYRGEELIISTYSLFIEFLVNLKSLRKCEELTKLEGEEGLELVKNEERESEEEPECHVDEGAFALAPKPFAFAQNSIEFRGFSARYRGRSSNVLDRVSFKVAPGEKVGVVGRTGSGKSTLILCLMRAIARAQGVVFVGGVDMATIPLSQLRAGISVVLQEHFLFTGNVRDNVDPLHGHSDAAVEAALAKCGLLEALRKRGGLQAQVAERGTNLSAGERQLLNLSRTLLSPRSIVLMDEATANIDATADAVLQKAMRTAFGESTVLSVAHRISTVLDCDRVLVLDNGKVAEFDTPKALLRNPQSLFRKLCDETGVTLNQPADSTLSSKNSIPIKFNYK